MSCEYKLIDTDVGLLELSEQSCEYTMYLDEKADERDYRRVTAALSCKDAMDVALNMLYAVWCAYPDEVENRLREVGAGICSWKNQQ